ncbi:MAG: hypothetical protein KDD64_16505, partial [Bdellovibrionales bacterium]|nr:hypothetical protein [Bdellovibrionales bacterium]
PNIDRNRDGIIDSRDIGLFMHEFGTRNPLGDFNGDRVFNGLDIGAFFNGWSHTKVEGCDS